MASVLANRYELAEPLGVGGSARVVAAYDRLLDRRVAVKLLGQVDDQRRAELLSEARAAARVSDPRVVAVYDAGVQDGRPFVVMELVEGESLAQRLARVGPLGTTSAAEVADAVLSALDAAHAAGLIHRDVKPANVLLPSGAPLSEAKLADFGIAKDRGDVGITQSGEVLGTPSYLAPEQIEGRQATPATDLYAVGVLLFETLAGQPPYSGATPLATALRHRDAPVPSLTAAAPGVPGDVAALVEQALAKDPADRPSTAEDMRTALAQATGSTPTYLPAAADTTGAEADGSTRNGMHRSGLRQARPTVLVALVALVALLGVWGLSGDGGLANQPPSGGEGIPEASGDSVDQPEADAERLEDLPDAAGLPDLDEPDDAVEAIAGLVEALADPEPADQRAAADVRDDLVEILGASDSGERAEDARELLVELGQWRAEGELSQATTARVAAAVVPLAQPDDDGLARLSRALAGLTIVAGEAGSAAPDVAAELAALLGQSDPDERADKARDLLADIADAVEDGEFDLDVTAPLAALLDKLATP